MRSFYRPSVTCQIPNLAGKWQALFGRRTSGFFVEVGAYDGDEFSNTSCLADVGWRGLYIEPVVEFAERCRARHKKNPGVDVVVAAASDREGSSELFMARALSTLDPQRIRIYDQIEWARGHYQGQSKTIQVSTLDTLLTARGVPPHFELLVVDVEGAEEKVFAGFDLARWRPHVIVVELEDVHPDFQGNNDIVRSAERIREKLRSAGYDEYYRDVINTIFIDRGALTLVPEEIHFSAAAPSRVTIGIPVRNGERTLRRAIDGILSQTFRSFDVVISDNASTDATATIINEYSKQLERLSVRWQASLISVMQNFCATLDGCNTELFVWLADDDWWEPSYLEKCIARLDEDPTVQLAFSDFRIYYHFLDKYSPLQRYAPSLFTEPELNFMARFYEMAPCAVYGIFRTEVIKEIVRRIPEAFDFSDVVVTLATALQGKMTIVRDDLFRAGVRDEKSIVRRSLDGGNIKYGRFWRETCKLIWTELGWRKFVQMLPLISARIYASRRHYRASLAKGDPVLDTQSLLGRSATTPPTDLAAYLKAVAAAHGVTGAVVRDFNQRTRDAWVEAKARTVARGARVLDVGAGTAPYRQFFAHCDYKTHDFAEYVNYLNGSEGKYVELDYISDVCRIPVPDASFDVILCTEVLEHVPRPIEALSEMARILKPGGRMFLTAPLGSGLHQEPFHFYGGYTPHWYRKFLGDLGCEIIEIVTNHGYFANLAQECCRFEWTFQDHKGFHGARGGELVDFMSNALAPYLFALDQETLIPEFTVGFHVEVRRLEKPSVKHSIDAKP